MYRKKGGRLSSHFTMKDLLTGSERSLLFSKGRANPFLVTVLI